jgi:hypothetical protein
MDSKSAPDLPDCPYRDQRLEPGQIRLLKIQQDARLQTLRLTTPPVALSDEPVYEALSYVWGTVPASTSVICNESKIHVSPSAHEMLEHLHLLQPDGGRFYWSDAVCINQRDKDEKATQILLMQDIYMHARSVLIWLGSSNTEMRAFMSDFSRVAELAESWNSTIKTTDPWWRGRDWPPDGHDFWKGLNSLLLHPWFTRLWTFQEVVLAERAMFISGLDSVDADDVIEFVWTSRLSMYGYLPTGDRPREVSVAMEATRILRYDRAKSGFDDRFQSSESPEIFAGNMSYLLHALRSRGVQEPVDRIWAIAELLDKDIQAKLSPSIDYSDQGRAQYWRTYVQFAKIVFTVYQSLILLDIPRAIKGRHIGQLSWCPDLSGQPICVLLLNGWWIEPISRQSPAKRFLLDPMEEQDGDQIEESTVHPLEFISTTKNDDLLRIRGYIMDTVEEVVQDPTLLGSESFWSETNWGRMFNHQLFETTRKTHLEALHLARRVYSSSADSSLSVPPEFIMSFLMDDRVGELSETAYRELLTWLTKPSLEHIKNIDDTRWRLLEPFLVWYRAVVGHSHFSTTGGRVGIATPALQPGDKVCAFYGGKSLDVLRYPEGSSILEPDYSTDHAEFCSIAYIPRLMKQQQRDDARLGPDEIFVIA